MKKLLVIALLGTALLTTSVTAGNVDMGMKVYGKKLKDACGFSGVKFTATHTPAEWKKFYDDGKLVDEIKVICPKVTEVKPAWVDHIYSFVYEYGKGSGNEPAC
ncbi:MAG: cytochrome C [Sulfurovum sp.]|nr:cytochrome C [Sulfurovum sp.]